MDEVYAGLYVGTLTGAGDELSIRDHGVKRIVSLTYSDPEDGYPNFVSVVTVAMMDGPRNKKAAFRDAVEEVLSAMAAEDDVLVHCSRGASRSPSVAATAVAVSEGIDLSEAFQQVAQHRAAVDPHEALVVHAHDIVAEYDT